MECLAEGLGLDINTFTEGTVDPGVGDSQSVLRLLHYHATEGKSFGPNFWRAGAHADFDVLTMVCIMAIVTSYLILTNSYSRKTVKVVWKFVRGEKWLGISEWAKTGFRLKPAKIVLCAISEISSCV
jgi:hypothetical protein